MPDFTVFADDLFDGTCWRGPACVQIKGDLVAEVRYGRDAWPSAFSAGDLTVTALLPGLIDSGVSASGYAEDPKPQDPFGPEYAFALLCLRYGVTTVVDLANSAAPLAFLRALHRNGRGPRVIDSAGRMVSWPSERHDIVVDPDDAALAVGAARACGARTVSLGRMDPGTRDAVVREAHRAAMPVIHARYAPSGAPTPGLMITRDGGAPPTPDYAGGLSALPASRDHYLAPQLHATSRWTVDGLLNAHDPVLAAPVLPHCRNFGRSRNAIARRLARPIVARYYGDRDAADLDGEVLARTRQAVGAGRGLASSGAGATGVVPGRSLWAEIAALGEAFGDPSAALAGALSVPATAFDRPDLGRIEAGCRADLVLTDPPPDQDHRDVAQLRAGLTRVVVGGTPLDVSELQAELDLLTEAAMKESP